MEIIGESVLLTVYEVILLRPLSSRANWITSPQEDKGWAQLASNQSQRRVSQCQRLGSQIQQTLKGRGRPRSQGRGLSRGA